MPMKQQDFLDRRYFKYSEHITDIILGYKHGLGQLVVTRNHYLLVNCGQKLHGLLQAWLTLGRLTEDARLLSA